MLLSSSQSNLHITWNKGCEEKPCAFHCDTVDFMLLSCLCIKVFYRINDTFWMFNFKQKVWLLNFKTIFCRDFADHLQWLNLQRFRTWNNFNKYKHSVQNTGGFPWWKSYSGNYFFVGSFLRLARIGRLLFVSQKDFIY